MITTYSDSVYEMKIAPNLHRDLYPDVGSNWQVKHYPAFGQNKANWHEEDWQKAIDMFEDRIRGRFLKIVEKIDAYEYAGFTVLALDALLIETLEQFKQGTPETPERAVENYFITFLTKTSFGKHFDLDKALAFYHQLRNGILHQAEAKENSRIRNNIHAPLVEWSTIGPNLKINRGEFHKRLVCEFEQYLSLLRNPVNNADRRNFRQKMDYVCGLRTLFIFDQWMDVTAMQAVAPSAKNLGLATLQNRSVWFKQLPENHQVAFLKKNKTNSMWAVLFQIFLGDVFSLDTKQPYRERDFIEVEKQAGEKILVEYYKIPGTHKETKPYSSLKQAVINAAQKNNLPRHYMNILASLPTIPDPP